MKFRASSNTKNLHVQLRKYSALSSALDITVRYFELLILTQCTDSLRTSLVPSDQVARSAARSRGLATSLTSLAQTVADTIFDRPELGLW